jgi:hypothetical protein
MRIYFLIFFRTHTHIRRGADYISLLKTNKNSLKSRQVAVVMPDVKSPDVI